MQYCYKNSGLFCQVVSNSYVAQAGDFLSSSFLTKTERDAQVSGFTAAFNALTTQQKIDFYLEQFIQYDNYVPRGLEDFWTATSFNTSTLPAQTQAILAAKVALRAAIQALS